MEINQKVSNLMERALLIANIAHQGQEDSKGCPYILFLLHVMYQLEETEQKIVALVMDSFSVGHFTRCELSSWGIPERIVEAVDALTRRPDEGMETFVRRCRANPLAFVVKQQALIEKIKQDQQLSSSENECLLEHRTEYEANVDLLDKLQEFEQKNCTKEIHIDRPIEKPEQI